MRKRPLATSLVSFLAGATIFGIVAAQAAPQENRPFDAVLEGQTTSAPTPDPGVFTTTSAGTIRGTHIGNGDYTITAESDYNRHEGEQDHPVGDCAFVEDGESGNGFVITAANGDQITGNIDDDRSVSCVSVELAGEGPDQEYLSTLYIEVTGGTGRFADASGWLFARGTSTLAGVDPNIGAQFNDVGVVLGDIDY